MIELIDFQAELGGVRLGAGTEVPVAGVEGLGRAGVRDADVERAGADGTQFGPDWYSAREIRIDAAIRTPGDPARALDILARLQAAADKPALRTVGGAVQELRMRWPGRDTRVALGRLRDLEPDLTRLVHGWVPVDVRFLAEPVWYSDSEEQRVLPLVRRWMGGFRAPLVPPIRVSVSGDDQAVNIPFGRAVNEGTVPAWPILTVRGPVVSPRVWSTTTGASLQLTGYIPAGVEIEIDTRPLRRTVTRVGGGNASNLLVGDMEAFSLPAGELEDGPEGVRTRPGVTEIRWESQEYATDARLTVRWRAAWAAL